MEKRKILAMLVLALAFSLCTIWPSEAAPIGTAFTYQGRLMDGGSPAEGEYDFQFKLYDSVADGNQVGSTIDMNALDAEDGYFTTVLDFNDANSFNGDARWLEVGVRPGEQEDPCDYTTLSPRQEVTPTPYAMYAKAGQNTDKVDGKHASDFMQNGAGAGGDLTGTYPNPTINSISASLIPHIETGSYTGNGSGTRDIAVSFTPSAVIVFDTTGRHLHTIIGNGNCVQQGAASPLFSSGGTLGTNKFTVGDDMWSANANGYSYYWVAFGSGG